MKVKNTGSNISNIDIFFYCSELYLAYSTSVYNVYRVYSVKLRTVEIKSFK